MSDPSVGDWGWIVALSPKMVTRGVMLHAAANSLRITCKVALCSFPIPIFCFLYPKILSVTKIK